MNRCALAGAVGVSLLALAARPPDALAQPSPAMRQALNDLGSKDPVTRARAAADLLREALRADPAGADLLFNLAAVLEADGRLQDALETYEKAGEDPAAREAAARVRRAIAWTP